MFRIKCWKVQKCLGYSHTVEKFFYPIFGVNYPLKCLWLALSPQARPEFWSLWDYSGSWYQNRKTNSCNFLRLYFATVPGNNEVWTSVKAHYRKKQGDLAQPLGKLLQLFLRGHSSDGNPPKQGEIFKRKMMENSWKMKDWQESFRNEAKKQVRQEEIVILMNFK